MTPWRDCAPCHSQPDGARLPLTRHPAYGTSPPTRANSVREGHSLPTACRIPPAMAARPPSSCRCGCLAPPSSPSIGIWLGPFAFPYPSSMVSTTRTSRFGGFGFMSITPGPSGKRPQARLVSLQSAHEPSCKRTTLWGRSDIRCSSNHATGPSIPPRTPTP